MRWARRVCIAIAVTTVGACGNQPSEPISVFQSSTETTAPNVKSTLELRGDLESPYAVVWEGYEIIDDRTVAVAVLSGRPDCSAASAAVTETATVVSIGIAVGGKPGAGACESVGVVSKVMVSLESPLNSRQVLDANASR